MIVLTQNSQQRHLQTWPGSKRSLSSDASSHAAFRPQPSVPRTQPKKGSHLARCRSSSVTFVIVDMLRDLIFRLALTLRRLVHGIVRLQTLTVLVSLVHPGITVLSFHDDALPTIPPGRSGICVRFYCNQFDVDDDQTLGPVLLHIFGFLPGPPEFLGRHTLGVINPIDLHVQHHCAVWVHTVRQPRNNAHISVLLSDALLELPDHQGSSRTHPKHR